MRDEYDRDIDKHTNEGPSARWWIAAGLLVAAVAGALWFKFG